jgi:hypothetical protein
MAKAKRTGRPAAKKIAQRKAPATKRVPRSANAKPDEARNNVATSHDLARLWQCTPRHVELLAKEGIAVRVGHGKYDPVKSTTNYIVHLREQAGGRVGQSPQADAVAASASFRAAQRDIAVRKLELMEGKLVNVDQVRERISALIRANKQFVLGLANQIAMDLSLSQHDLKVVRNLCHAGLRDASAGLGVFAPVIEPIAEEEPEVGEDVPD